MMKLYYVLTLLQILLAAVTANFLNIGINLDKVGVRVLLNEGNVPTDGSFCNDDDQLLLQASLNEILPITRQRNLREEGQQDRKLASCRQLCKGFPRSQCYVVYRDCARYRRTLEGEEGDEHEEEEEVEEEEEDEELTRRSLLINLNLSIGLGEKCLGLEALVVAQVLKLTSLVGGLSQSCVTLAQKKKTVKCFVMD